jgi:hypothetical protein
LESAAQKRILGGLYVTAAGRMTRRPGSEQTQRLFRDSLNILTYVRDSLPELYGSDITRMLHEVVLEMSGQAGSVEFPEDRAPPRVVKVKPDGVTGGRSDIVAKMNDGPISESQIALDSLQLDLDGTRVTPAVFTKTSRSPKSGPNRVFQKTKLRYRPPHPLSPGVHQVSLRIADLAGNQVEKSWSFEVRTQKKDDRDDEAGDDRCDGEPDDSDD